MLIVFLLHGLAKLGTEIKSCIAIVVMHLCLIIITAINHHVLCLCIALKCWKNNHPLVSCQFITIK